MTRLAPMIRTRGGCMVYAVILCLLTTGCRAVEGPEPNPPRSVLSIAAYPPADRPYFIERGDFWLVHIQGGELSAFVPVSPAYVEHITVDECRYTWVESGQRFVDPCSGDEWELNGRLNLAHSTELWSRRDLDRYDITVRDQLIYVRLDETLPGASRTEPSSP